MESVSSGAERRLLAEGMISGLLAVRRSSSDTSLTSVVIGEAGLRLLMGIPSVPLGP